MNFLQRWRNRIRRCQVCRVEIPPGAGLPAEGFVVCSEECADELSANRAW